MTFLYHIKIYAVLSQVIYYGTSLNKILIYKRFEKQCHWNKEVQESKKHEKPGYLSLTLATKKH